MIMLDPNTLPPDVTMVFSVSPDPHTGVAPQFQLPLAQIQAGDYLIYQYAYVNQAGVSLVGREGCYHPGCRFLKTKKRVSYFRAPSCLSSINGRHPLIGVQVVRFPKRKYKEPSKQEIYQLTTPPYTVFMLHVHRYVDMLKRVIDVPDIPQVVVRYSPPRAARRRATVAETTATVVTLPEEGRID